MGKTEKWENIFWVTKPGNKGITNRGRFSGLQIREWGITNRGSFWDFKSGKKNYKSGQRDFKTEYRLQTGVRSISNWGRDYKSVKNKCDVTWFLFLFLFYSFLCTMQFLFYSSPERVGVRWKLDVEGEGVNKILDVDEQGNGTSWKLDNFHGRRMCVVP